MIKRFTLDDERMKDGGKRNDYFDELIERGREIRTSERNFYRKIADIYATSYDYDSKSDTAHLFFATIQNKFHWAIHGHTAAELIAERAVRAGRIWVRLAGMETNQQTGRNGRKEPSDR